MFYTIARPDDQGKPSTERETGLGSERGLVRFEDVGERGRVSWDCVLALRTGKLPAIHKMSV